MQPTRQTHVVDIAGLKRELPLFEVDGGVRIAVVNILGDTALVQAAASALASRLGVLDYSVLVTAEAKSIPLVHALSVATARPYVVLRKSFKPYMGDALSATTRSITTGEEQTLYLDEKDRRLIEGSRIVLVDDVISSGSTLKAMRNLVDRAGAITAAEAAIFTEGDRADWADVIALGHLPVFDGSPSTLE
ncbi:phosphoribosyltransferase family protein [Salinisphaera sp. Q1T1-3]|uniref:phosphoribosyltransferase family protein n=1 Tax=Salinisphaera sp. Q1T1-3 TaxID=2321229 RepID=UPI000E769E62|nr:phosphoribosyltransferase family protein [Salinisphaera sp. Q1T1-3]RJS94265.1 adenine phosphoribosyltransferase [Salinisphaera sp. Q1T1-3]